MTEVTSTPVRRELRRLGKEVERGVKKKCERECAQGRNGNVSNRVRQWQTNRKWESSKPLGMEALAQFQVMLMALISHLDLYCRYLRVSQGLPNTAQGCCNSLWSLEIKSKDKSNGKFVSVLFYSIASRSGAVENSVDS